jgi:hypothetical protein
MSETQHENNNPVQNKLTVLKSFWQSRDQKDRNKIVGGCVFLALVLATPLFSSGSMCSRSETTALAEQVFGNFLNVASIDDAREIGHNKASKITTCGANLSMRNGAQQYVEYTVESRPGNVIWVEAKGIQ